VRGPPHLHSEIILPAREPAPPEREKREQPAPQRKREPAAPAPLPLKPAR